MEKLSIPVNLNEYFQETQIRPTVLNTHSDLGRAEPHNCRAGDFNLHRLGSIVDSSHQPPCRPALGHWTDTLRHTARGDANPSHSLICISSPKPINVYPIENRVIFPPQTHHALGFRSLCVPKSGSKGDLSHKIFVCVVFIRFCSVSVKEPT